jgi:hypothetical protein
MISGKSFADMCAWVIDPRYPHRQTFSYAHASHGDWVFINGDYVVEILSRIPILHAKKFVFVVHNSDRSFDKISLGLLIQHAIHIYAINTVVSHPRLTTIPLGFVDRQLSFLETFKPEAADRDIKIYANFTQATNIEKRKDCIQVFKEDPRVTWRSQLTVPEYYADLCRSEFVLCPEGTGIDTHRVYESLLCGATPVVLRNSLSHLYEKLPVCIVNSWTDTFFKPAGVYTADVSFFTATPPR